MTIIAITLTACSGAAAQVDYSYGPTSSLLLINGSINGQSVGPANRTVVVSPGSTISGSFTVSINSTFPSNDVMAMGVTPTWGNPAASYTDLGGFGTPVSGLTRTITVNLTAPTTVGTYYIIAAYQAEFTAGEVMSCTNWQVGSLDWNSGYAVADWSASTIQTADMNGTVLVNYLFPASIPFTQQYVPATAIQILVGTNITAAGIYRISDGLFILNSQFNNIFTSADTVTSFAGNGLTPEPSDIPVAGDWSGSGTTKIGLYRPSTGSWFLDWNGNGVFDGPAVDRQYQYGGVAGDIPVVGDWNGTAFSKVGIFRSGFLFLLNLAGNGIFSSSDAVFGFGGLTGCTGPLPSFFDTEPEGSCDIPVVGDWDNSGTTKVGIVRAAPGTSQPFLWILDTTGVQQIIPPGPGKTGASTICAFGGLPGDVPIVGHWSNTPNTNVGVFRDSFLWVEDTTANLPTCPAATDTLVVFPYGGVSGDEPIVGHW